MIKKIDYNIAKFFHNIYLNGGQFANKFMQILSFVAEAGILFLVIGLTLSLFKRTRKIGGTILLSVALGFVITNIILKPSITRLRPFQNLGSNYYKWWLDAGAISESGYSFPSGHTTATTAFAIAIFLTTSKKYSWPILLFPILMASSRIYLMVHYFTDCIGGIAVGAICSIAAWVIVNLIYKSKLKLFVFIKELDLFKSKHPVASNAQSNTVVAESGENDYVYIRQDEEHLTAENDNNSSALDSNNDIE